jgi:hypothetical protein
VSPIRDSRDHTAGRSRPTGDAWLASAPSPPHSNPTRSSWPTSRSEPPWAAMLDLAASAARGPWAPGRPLQAPAGAVRPRSSTEGWQAARMHTRPAEADRRRIRVATVSSGAAGPELSAPEKTPTSPPAGRGRDSTGSAREQGKSYQEQVAKQEGQAGRSKMTHPASKRSKDDSVRRPGATPKPGWSSSQLWKAQGLPRFSLTVDAPRSSALSRHPEGCPAGRATELLSIVWALPRGTACCGASGSVEATTRHPTLPSESPCRRSPSGRMGPLR